ncbi:MAG: hypothetical protein ACI4XW_12375 [Candidatus Spyradocola sp.]
MSNQRNPQGVTLSRGAMAIALAIVVVLVTGGVVLGMNWSRWFGGDEPETVVIGQKDAAPFTPDIDPNAGDWTGETLPDKSGEEAVGIKIPGYPYITLPADQQTVRLTLLNPEDNPCYFTFNLVLRDTGEVLYTSKMVPPGQSINEVELAHALPAGEYNATIQISTTSLEDGSAMNGANVETVLIVK